MNKYLCILAALFSVSVSDLQAATTSTSCSSTAPSGYVMTKIQERSTSCSGGNLYTYTRLAGETVLDTCIRTTPTGWVNTKERSYTGSGICGSSSGTPRLIWQITNSYGQTKLNSCLRTLPTGWVITRQTSYSGSGDCGTASGSKRTKYEAQSTAGQSQMSVCNASTLPSGWEVGATSSSSNCGTGSGNLWKILNTKPLTKVALHHYIGKTGDNMYVTKRDDAAMALYKYSYNAIAAQVPSSAAFGTTVLHRYYNSSIANSLYTIGRDDAYYSKVGYVYVGAAANVFTAKVPNATALHRYWNPTTKHHLYSVVYSSTGINGFKYEKAEGYVYKP
ncbi:hypothetical protein HNE05_20140 [Aquipseudomonas campi]|uniref:DUF5648 domain-containing protein n=1 Tax=Aquipseudomonas campi TaxID=2731681 RepID=A0A6M8FE41_9GAMM|nr:hypothetical protein [Pseudomonas campi]QKE65571.1 hypothetical protein HNE05_20140 [Pseudomonas campi]